jgi:hypothetical protein
MNRNVNHNSTSSFNHTKAIKNDRIKKVKNYIFIQPSQVKPCVQMLFL